MLTKDEFLKHIQLLLAADFESRGFIYRNDLWRKIKSPVLCILEMQERSDRSAICANLGIHLDFLPAAGSSELSSMDILEPPDCEIRKRLAWPGESDHWWKYGEPRDVAELSNCVREYGFPYFDMFLFFPMPFTEFGPNELESPECQKIFPILTRVRKALLFARVYDFLGESKKVLEYCEYGESVVGKAVSTKAVFRQLEKKHRR